MGQAIFKPKEIPTRFDSEEAIGKKIMANGKEFEVNCVSMGNPHCVVLKEQLSIDEIKEYGRYLEHHEMFPTELMFNLLRLFQEMKQKFYLGKRSRIYFSIRTSSCAVACVLRKEILLIIMKIKMLGGELTIEIDDDFNVRMTGKLDK